MKTINKTAYNLLFLVLLAFLIYPILKAPVVKAQQQGSAALALSGEELFIQNRCVRCHTIGRGRFVGPDLAGVDGRYPKEQIANLSSKRQNAF
jgi:mono/diheme cytochrome c family protein